MADTKLSALDTGTLPDYYYGIEGGVGKKYNGAGIVNVKDLGAKGDGVTDDTAFIQAAFDAAFGSWTSPHSITNATLNKSVFFPGGNYLVRSATTAKTVTNAVDDGSNAWGGGVGYIKLTLNSTTGLNNGDMVYVRGVSGVPESNACYPISAVTATTVTLYRSVFSGTYISGGTLRPSCLRIKDTLGGKIYGAGKSSTKIFTDSTNCAVMSVLGWQYGRIDDIAFASDAGGVAFDLNGDNSTTATTQSSKFDNCSFGGSAAVNGDYCVTIGCAHTMCSEIGFYNCFYATGAIAGLAWFDSNALSGTVIGGNFAIGGNPSASVYGILVNTGSCPTIAGVGFQHLTGTDIYISNSQGDSYTISGCRTESENFLKIGGGLGISDVTVTIDGCAQTTGGSATGYFVTGGGNVIIDGCASAQGTNKYVSISHGNLSVRNSSFSNSDYWYGGSGENYRYLEITPQPKLAETSTSVTLASKHLGCKVTFNNASPIAVSVPDASGWAADTGAFVDVQQIGAGKVTFAGSGFTIKSRGGLLSLNGNGAVGRLFCDSAGAWTLSGDIAA